MLPLHPTPGQNRAGSAGCRGGAGDDGDDVGMLGLPFFTLRAMEPKRMRGGKMPAVAGLPPPLEQQIPTPSLFFMHPSSDLHLNRRELRKQCEVLWRRNGGRGREKKKIWRDCARHRCRTGSRWRSR
nr:unnamed protein product [Digitaria exilis]